MVPHDRRHFRRRVKVVEPIMPQYSPQGDRHTGSSESGDREKPKCVFASTSASPEDERNAVLQFFEKLTRRTRDVNPTGDAAFAVFYAFHDAGGFAALGAVGALGGVHDLFSVSCLSDLGSYGHD